MLLASGRKESFLLLLAITLLAQNLLAMILLRTGLIPSDDGQYLLLIKELLVAATLIGLIVLVSLRVMVRGSFRFAALPTAIFLWCGFLAVHALAFGPPWLARLAGMRSLAVLPALFLLGYLLTLGRKGADFLVRIIAAIGITLAVFGLIEAYVLPTTFWLDIGHEEYYEMKIGRPIQGSLYGNMRAWIAGEPVRRVASLTGDPLISSYPMALVLILVFARYMQRFRFAISHLLILVPVALATALTLSRGAALSVIIAAGLLVVAARRSGSLVALAVLGVLGVTAGTLLFGDEILQITSGRGHIQELSQGLMRGFDRPMGHGLGSASSVATGVARSNLMEGVVLGGGDSFLGSVATQTGMVGAFLFYGLMLWMVGVVAARGAAVLRRGESNAWWFTGTAAMMAALVVTSAVNESGFGFIASGLTYLLGGALVSLRAEALVTSVSRLPEPRAALAAGGD